mmetsp:Transcript_47316/g.153598  ORF Transcript_47316/g.153598 Transcript_47316/m.153598 type:complete len:382 (-) Transcript_47316:134-1279(-)
MPTAARHSNWVVQKRDTRTTADRSRRMRTVVPRMVKPVHLLQHPLEVGRAVTSAFCSGSSAVHGRHPALRDRQRCLKERAFTTPAIKTWRRLALSMYSDLFNTPARLEQRYPSHVRLHRAGEATRRRRHARDRDANLLAVEEVDDVGAARPAAADRRPQEHLDEVSLAISGAEGPLAARVRKRAARQVGAERGRVLAEALERRPHAARDHADRKAAHAQPDRPHRPADVGWRAGASRLMHQRGAIARHAGRGDGPPARRHAQVLVPPGLVKDVASGRRRGFARPKDVGLPRRDVGQPLSRRRSGGVIGGGGEARRLALWQPSLSRAGCSSAFGQLRRVRPGRAEAERLEGAVVCSDVARTLLLVRGELAHRSREATSRESA